mmetsp:Transcript_59481/g.158256  ORF Transcript_59481/g.158256 Transcript_59481/m.158256 type:complete len:180 (+) Transcript_59481:258-797(+)
MCQSSTPCVQNPTATLLNISWFAVELPRKATAICSPSGETSQTPAFMVTILVMQLQHLPSWACDLEECRGSQLTDMPRICSTQHVLRVAAKPLMMKWRRRGEVLGKSFEHLLNRGRIPKNSTAIYNPLEEKCLRRQPCCCSASLRQGATKCCSAHSTPAHRPPALTCDLRSVPWQANNG